MQKGLICFHFYILITKFCERIEVIFIIGNRKKPTRTSGERGQYPIISLVFVGYTYI